METKTNVMRLLDSMKLPYQSHSYPADPTMSGVDVAAAVGIPAERVYKTLVTVGKSGRNYVFVIPVALELNLKKAAQASGEKSVEMVKAKVLLPLTGYIHGGCSPIGMKKLFPTYVDASAAPLETLCFSAGKVGYQVEMAPALLAQAVPCQFAELT